MNKDLTIVLAWLKGNKLSLNVAKTKAMVISSKQNEKHLVKNNEKLSSKIQGERIDNVLTAKYLGIQVDRNFYWIGHIKVLSSKLTKAAGFLNMPKNFQLLTLYRQYILVSLRHILDIAALFGEIVVRLKGSTCKTSK